MEILATNTQEGQETVSWQVHNVSIQKLTFPSHLPPVNAKQPPHPGKGAPVCTSLYSHLKMY